MRNGKLFLLAALLLLSGFIAGLIEIFSLRFSQGDIYPYYSSLRADPLGTKAYYEALQRCCGLSIERNYQDFSLRKNDSNAAMLFLGIVKRDLEVIPEQEAFDLEFFLRNGGRLVFSYLPKTEKEEEGIPSEDLPATEEEEDVKFTSLEERWQFTVLNVAADSESPTAHLAADAPSRLPADIAAHTRLCFSKLGKDWQTLYRVEGRPVMIERKFGKGSILLSTVSYFLSNEAMLEERHPELLLFLLDKKQRAIFDEYHNGVAMDPGVASLLRKFHLEWTITGLLLLAGLFVWKNSLPLVPARGRAGGAVLSEGKDTASGLTNLLRRNVPEKEAITICFQEWRKSNSGNNKLELIDSILQSTDKRKPHEVYNAVSAALKRRG